MVHGLIQIVNGWIEFLFIIFSSSFSRCTECASVTPNTGQLPATISCCSTTSTNYKVSYIFFFSDVYLSPFFSIKDGICLTYIISATGNIPSGNYNNRFNVGFLSFFKIIII
jgi:hypothetical protein